MSDVTSLVAAIPGRAEAHVLQPGHDGLDQILAHLSGRRDFGAIHVLCHGEPGRLLLGSGWLAREHLEDRATDLARLGRALESGGDLLLYGCRVALGEEGRAFVERIAELTGADVAGSETLTGASALGGDWRLQVRRGMIETRPLEVPGYHGVLTVPTVGAPSPVNYTEGGAVQLLQGVTLANGLGYAGGSLRIEIGGATADDQLTLTSDSDPNAAGAVSIAGGAVYLGNGSGRDAIGTVDAMENGQNGAALVIHFTANDTGAVTNPSFESGVTGWTVGESRVILGTTSLNGWVTPSDPTSPNKSGGDADPINSMTYDSELSTAEHTDGGSSLRLFNDGQTSAGFDVVHGPYAFSNTFGAQAGDTFHFDWRANAGQDAYDAFGYLMNADTGQAIIVINETAVDDTGVREWTTGSVTVPTDGNYFFVFVSGTYDFTGGKAVGGSLYIDNFRVEASLVTDDVIEAITGNVAYQNTADDPPADPRTLTVVVTDGVGDTASADGQVVVTNVNDELTGGVQVAGAAEQGAILTASNDISDPDGMGPVIYHWQREQSPGQWADIDGADQATYQLTQADVGKAVRAIADYTDGGGSAESFTSNPTTAVANAQFAPAGGVQLTGEAEQGAVLTATNDIVDPDGTGPVAYHWQREETPGQWVDIGGADEAAYRLTQADVGKAVRAVGSYTDGDGHAETLASGPTAAVANVNDAPTGAVTVSGRVLVGSTLTAGNSLADADGLGAISYQWQADGVDIDGATGGTLQITSGLLGKSISVVASYVDGGGTAESVASGSTAAVANPPVDPGPPPPPPTSTDTIDGMQVATGSLLNPDGSTSAVVTVPVVTPSREEIVGDAVLADIPLLKSAGGETLLLAQIPTGLGLQALGPATIKSAALSSTDLIREIRAHTDSGSEDQTHLTGGGSGYLAGIPGDAPLLVRSIVLNGAAGAPPPAAALVLSGAGDESHSPETALVIDGRLAADGIRVDLQKVQFAAVIGSMDVTGDGGVQSLWGDGGRQSLWLGDGNDLARGGAGDDRLQGNAGDDNVSGDEGKDLVYGGQGQDVVTGGADDDRLFGDAGDDWVQGNTGQDTISGGAGSDTISGGQGADTLFGDSQSDRMFGDLGDDWLQGNTGQDTLEGGAGSDTVFGGQDDDAVFGGASSDLLFGDVGDDFVQGNDGDDRLLGFVGNDLLHGGKGNDVLFGEDGADTLSGDFGDDVLFGGAGADVFRTFEGSGVDRVMDFSAAEGDRVYIEHGTTYSVLQAGADVVIDLGEGHQTILIGVQLPSLPAGWILGG